MFIRTAHVLISVQCLCWDAYNDKSGYLNYNKQKEIT